MASISDFEKRGLLIGLGVKSPGAGQILNDVSNGFVHRDLLGRTAAFDLTREHLPDLGNDVVIADQSGLLGAGELCSLPEDAFTAIGNEAGANHQLVIHFGGADVTGADQVQVRTRLNPGAVQDWLACRSDGADDVRLSDGFFTLAAAEIGMLSWL